MAVIKEALRNTLDALPAIALRRLLRQKAKRAGISIPPQAVEAFVQHVLTRASGKFVWTPRRVRGVQPFDLVIDDTDLKELESIVKRVAGDLPRVVAKTSDAISLQYFESLSVKWDEEWSTQLKDLSGFRERLESRWGEGLSFLRMLLTCCRELARETFKRHRRSRSQRHMYRRWVMARLHARACQVSDEVICLMENGFADGAMARWRTLHEVAVVASLISEGDEALAERYIMHDAVEVKRQADDHDATQVPLGFSPVGKRQRSKIERQYQLTMDRFGAAFASPYGWAANALKLKKPTFKDLQVKAGREAMNSYYKLASFNVHASARSLFFNLGSMPEQDAILGGRSNAGLVEPGVRTAQTLSLITTLYLGRETDLDRITEFNSVLHIMDAVAPALQAAESKLHSDELKRQGMLAKRRAKGKSLQRNSAS